ncbi:MAG: ECF transporter S component [Bacillota bacterium]|nr:ECF transporter S component [Bacillota bacterium]
MSKMSTVKKSIITAVCIALCYALPLLFHGVQNAGIIFTPMHIPVFICGLVCGWQYGLLCGIAGPALSSAMTGMPPAAMLPSMMVELAVYGVVTGLLMKVVRTKNTVADLYICLIAAIILGRAMNAVTKALIFAKGEFALGTWVTGTLLVSWPGILIQLVFIPTVVVALMKAHLIPERYPRLED